jgi:TatD DNase family protein
VLVDSHCHIHADELAEDREAVFARATDVGVGAIVAPATDADSAERALALARDGRPVRVAVGVHPGSIHRVRSDEWSRIEELARAAEVVAIGETGLDYYRDREHAAEQRAWFDRHLALAGELGLPVIVHNREADEDVLAAIANWRGGRTDRIAVLHCFVGAPELAERALALGCYLGFGGPITFKSAETVRETARVVPMDRVLVETDSPYLAPAPHRGHRNEPAYVRLVAERLADVRDLEFGEVARATGNNAVQVFGLQSLEARPIARGLA